MYAFHICDQSRHYRRSLGTKKDLVFDGYTSRSLIFLKFYKLQVGRQVRSIDCCELPGSSSSYIHLSDSWQNTT